MRRSENDIIKPIVCVKSKTITDNFNEITITFKQPFSLIFRAYDDAVAYHITTFIDNPVKVLAELKKFLKATNSGEAKLFNHNFSHKRWKKICEDAGLADLKFHDLRKTFGSMLAQRGVSTSVTQRLLERSSSTLTNKIYTNVDPVLRQSVNQLPVEQW